MKNWIIRYQFPGSKISKINVQSPYRPSKNQASELVPRPFHGHRPAIISIQEARH